MSKIFTLYFLLLLVNAGAQTSFSEKVKIFDPDALAPMVKIISLDDDHFQDVVTVIRWGNNQRVVWQKNLGQNSFSDERLVTDQISQPLSCIGMDIDNDGDQDIIVTNIQYDIFTYINDGLGNFIFNDQITETEFTGIKSFDINKDGFMDLVYWSYGEKKVGYLLNDLNGSFLQHVTVAENLGNVVNVEVIDINNDGGIDICTISNTGLYTISSNNNLTFSDAIFIQNLGSNPRVIESENMNEDTFMDLVIGGTNSNSVSILYNDGAGSFENMYQIDSNPVPFKALEIADINSDGNIDIISGNEQGTTIIYYNQLNQNQFTKSIINENNCGNIWSIQACDLDRDCDVDILVKHSDSYLYENEQYIEGTDLDNDGFNDCFDCDDNNPNINPDADDIPNNGIDEDCDGMDLTSSTHEIANTVINIYPNPAIDIINIDVDGQLEYQSTLYNFEGKIIKTSINNSLFRVETIPSGTYFLEIKDQKTGQKIVEKIVIGK